MAINDGRCDNIRIVRICAGDQNVLAEEIDILKICARLDNNYITVMTGIDCLLDCCIAARDEPGFCCYRDCCSQQEKKAQKN